MYSDIGLLGTCFLSITTRISGDATRPLLHARRRPLTSSQTGLTFWFIRKRLVGSYFFLSSTNRLYVAP